MSSRSRAAIALLIVAAVASFAIVAINGNAPGVDDVREGPPSTAGQPSQSGADARPSTTRADATTTTTMVARSTTTLPARKADTLQLARTRSIGGRISPKSVDANGAGLVFAQNMMYTHSVTVYDARTGELKATIPDSVDLSKFGVGGHPGISKGAPVEAAFTRDGRDAYVTNYSMYGTNWGPEGSDSCRGPAGYDPSFVYRIDTKRLVIDQVIAVGVVPKYVAVTPDDRYVLVTNWCSYDLSIIDRRAGREVKRIPIGNYPRGIAVSPDGRTAYIAHMGGRDIAIVDLRSFTVDRIWNVGNAPRHLVISRDGRTLYATLNGEGTVAKIDLPSRSVVARVRTGRAPRSMTISSDGTALYVVNYESSTVSVLRTEDLSIIQTLPTDSNPIGITYEPVTRSVWVACYTGTILVFAPQ